VVVGASGNHGTAILRRFAREDVEVVAVARRIPVSPPRPPYDVPVRWVSCDVAGPDAPAQLARAMRGADAVVHLAWAIQPSHDRLGLRSTNVGGTAAMLEAARRAGVGHVVAASSVGAYAPVDDDVPRDERWPATGIDTSSYSSDKAAQERLLDEHEAAGGAPVARLRPALTFQAGAGAEVGRLFLGPFVPKRVLRGPLPVLPWPSGLRLQAVHADDLADAYVCVVLRRAVGAFNVGAPDVLGGADVAAVLRTRRVVPVPPAVVRAALVAAWRARLAVVGPGWLDMALRVPVLDSSRAERELDWRPTRTGRESLAELVAALAAGTGSPSLPLHPRRRVVARA
jgi:nucleoside-diphosphate-sugar epimerase